MQPAECEHLGTGSRCLLHYGYVPTFKSTMPNRSKVAFTTRFSASATESTPSTTTSADQPPYVEIYDPCGDFWSPFCYSFGFNRLTFEFGIVALLVMIQLSMLLLIVARCRRDPSFRQAFYAQFVAVTIVDCLRMFMVRAVILSVTY